MLATVDQAQGTERSGEGRMPYPGLQTYPRNEWYIAAFATEVGREPLARTILDTPVVIYRTEEGRAVALYDRCPHRGLPLSVGKVRGDSIQCGYHGIEFGPEGQCTLIPQNVRTPPTMCVQHYPLIELNLFLWIWMGDPQKADQTLLPDQAMMGLGLGLNEVPYHTYEIHSNYQFMHDNLMDSSHLSYLHGGLIETGELAGAPLETEKSERLIKSVRRARLKFQPEPAQRYRVTPDYEYELSLSSDTYVPSVHLGVHSVRDPANPDKPPQSFFIIHGLTPMTARKTLMFHARSAPYEHGTERDRQQVWRILEQDKVAMEIIQQRFDEFGDTHEVSIATDSAQMQCRRMIDQLIRAEGLGR